MFLKIRVLSYPVQAVVIISRRGMLNLTCARTDLVAAGAGRQGWCFQGYKSGDSSAPRHTHNHTRVTCSIIFATNGVCF
jgi:hypothetical protein